MKTDTARYLSLHDPTILALNLRPTCRTIVATSMEKRVALLCLSAAILALFYMRQGDDFDRSSLRGKVVLITGASTGIGEQLAYQYAQTGATLFLTARREDVLRRVAAKCRQLGSSKVEVVAGDMGDAVHRQQVALTTRKLFGRLDHLILNHVATHSGFWKGNAEDVTNFLHLLNVNLVAYVDMASRSLDLLNQSGGAIGVVSSLAGTIAMPTLASYSSTKSALEGFFSALRQELVVQESNVTVTTCVLGFIATDAALEFMQQKQGYSETASAMAAQPNATAAAIMESVARRQSVMYYPPSMYWIILGHRFFPGLVESFVSKELC